MSQQQLTQEQIQDVQQCFHLFDKDGNGQINEKEIAEVMRALGQNPTQAEIKEMIAEVDKDANGMVSYVEFEAMVSKRKLNTVEDEMEAIKEAFRVFDQNGDGFITVHELSATLQSIGDPLSREEVENMIKEADLNGDGKVNYEEFAEIMCHSL